MAEKTTIVIGATDETGPAFKTAQRNMEALQKSVGATAQQHQIAAVQVKDFIEQIISGGSPIRAFAQQGAAVVSNYGGVSKTFAALGGLLSPLVLAVGATAGAVGGLAVAFIAGSKEARAFADTIKLTGNFAGQTAGQFDDIARQVAATSQTTVSAAREFGLALAKTGQIGPQNFRVATEAATRYGEATGKTADAVASDFVAMGADVAKWAADHNRQLHFITAAQYEQIKALQDGGRAVEAQGVVYDALNQHLKGLDTNLGYIDRSLAGASKGWDKFWTAAKGAGKPETVADELKALQQQLDNLKPDARNPFAAPASSVTGQLEAQRAQAARAQIEAKIADADRRQFRQSEAVSADAIKAATEQDLVAADQRLEGIDKQIKGTKELDKAVAQLHRDWALKAAQGSPVEPATQKLEEGVIRRQFGSAQTADLQKTLDGRLKALQDEAEQEHDLFQNSEALLTTLYQHGDLSIEQYFAAKQAAADDDLKKQRANLDKRIADIRSHQDAIKGLPLEPEARKTAQQDDENKINALLDAQAKLERESGQAATATGMARTTALEESAKAMRDLDAQIADLNGDKATARQLRNLQTVDDARQKILSKQTGGDAAREKALENAIYLQGQFNAVQEAAAEEANTAQTREELFTIAAKRAGLDREATEKGLLDLHEQRITQLDKEIARVGDLIALSRLQNAGVADPGLIRFYNDLRVAREKAFDEKDPGLQRFNDLARQGGEDIANAFEDAVFQGGRLSDMLQKLGLDLGRLVLHDLVTKPLADSITSGIQNIGKTVSGKGTNAPGGVDAAGAVVGSFAPAIGTATTALDGFAAALTNASGTLAAVPGAIPTPGVGIGQPGPVLVPSSTSAEDVAATVTADKAIADLGETAKSGAKDLGAASGTLVQGLASVASSMGGLPAAFSQLITGIIALAGASNSSSSGGFFAGLLALFSGSSGKGGGGGGGSFGGGGPSYQAAAGGPAPAGALIRVNERGPELLAIDGKQFLMMGRTPGRIVPGDRVAPALAGAGLVGDSSNTWRQREGGGNVYITNNTPANVSATRDDKGDWRVMVDAAAKQAHQMVAADHMSGSGPSSAALRKRGVNLDGSNPRRQ